MPTLRLRSLGMGAATLLLLAAAIPTAAQHERLVLRSPPQSALVYGRDGSLIAELGPQARTLVPLRSLPAFVPKAFVAVEDRRFYEHRGVDPVGVARALRNTAMGDREGASTITQQLIGAMYPERVDRTEMTAERKLREMRLALELEERYGKDRILEAYLNQIYFGHGWFGIEAAARHYFGKSAARLNVEEAAMLAALPKGPGVYSPKINPQRALERRNLVLDLMAENGVISVAEAASAKGRPIRLAANHGYSVRPRWAVEQVRAFLEERYGPEYGRLGLRVWTTIDPVAQSAADTALVQGLDRVERLPWFRGPRRGAPGGEATAAGTPYLQGAVVTLDARTGEILAMVGGRDWEESKFNRATMARRQPGSAFKPVVYAAAIERGVTPATVVLDTALRIEQAGSPPYQPRNSDQRFRGPMTVRQALTESVNTVAIQLGMQVGMDTVGALARRLGIDSPIPPYPAAALGAGAVRPLELAEAYTALANRGIRVEPFLVRRVADRQGRILFDEQARGARALSAATAFALTDVLRGAAEHGTGQEARQRLPTAVPMAGKTGTTNDGADVWYAGYTPELVTVVWVGFDRPRSFGPGAFGGSVAAPIWGEAMRRVYARRPAPATWTPPAGVLTVAADPATGLPLAPPCPARAERVEYFRAGTEPFDACLLRGDRIDGREAPLPELLPSIPADSLPPAPATDPSER